MVEVNIFNTPFFTQYFLNPIGLYSLLGLLALLLIYLVRPKPKRKTIPSLMFFFRNQQKSRLNSFFRYISRNVLFLLHFLIVTLLVAAIATPYILERQHITAETTAIVLDVSASMQVKDGFSSRFEKAQDIAKKNLGKRNTLIIAGASAELLDTLRIFERFHIAKLKVTNRIIYGPRQALTN